MSKGKKLSLIVASVLLLGWLWTFSGCLCAYYEQHKVRTGMTVPVVFTKVDHWNLCITTTRFDGRTHEFAVFSTLKEPGDELYRVAKYDKTLTSKPEFVQFVSQEMNNGKAWSSQFTYYGPVRNTFRVDFDAAGKVISVSDMAVRP